VSYPISTMIGIRTGGVYYKGSDMNYLKRLIVNVINKMEKDDVPCDISEQTLGGCMSTEQVAPKGSYVTIAGVFNSWNYEHSSEFGKRLSKELGTEIMVMSWDENTNKIKCGVFLAGKDIRCVSEDLISRALRRTT